MFLALSSKRRVSARTQVALAPSCAAESGNYRVLKLLEKRYSWGYGACPDLTQHEIVWRLLDVERAIGASLTSAHQIITEQSTAAIVIHHPRAAYFNAAAVRELTAV